MPAIPEVQGLQGRQAGQPRCELDAARGPDVVVAACQSRFVTVPRGFRVTLLVTGKGSRNCTGP